MGLPPSRGSGSFAGRSFSVSASETKPPGTCLTALSILSGDGPGRTDSSRRASSDSQQRVIARKERRRDARERFDCDGERVDMRFAPVRRPVANQGDGFVARGQEFPESAGARATNADAEAQRSRLGGCGGGLRCGEPGLPSAGGGIVAATGGRLVPLRIESDQRLDASVVARGRESLR